LQPGEAFPHLPALLLLTLRDLALTAADWARRVGAGEAAIQHAKAYAFEAEHKMGEMLAETELNTGTKGQLNGKDVSGVYRQTPPEDDRPTLAEIGITKHESARAQKVAALPEETFGPDPAEARRRRETILTARRVHEKK
jgi:hypothetical protein